MLDSSSSVTQLFNRSFQVDTFDDTELDMLDFGVVALDSDGVILRYNSYEARLARLDRNQVLGRNFFREIAPCTQSDAFEGRFRRLVSNTERARSTQFEFLFDFKFGAQQVQVEIISIADENRYYLLINRSKVLPARPDLPASGYAVLQQELAPNETQLGVRRDPREQRVIEVPSSWLAALRVTCNRLAPETWQLFCSDWGGEWGRRAAQELEIMTLEQRGAAFREQSMREVASTISDYFARQGWGLIRFDFVAAREGVIVAEVERSVLAELVPPSRVPSETSAELSCYLLAGCLSSLLTHIAAKRLTVREVSCQAGGASLCTFVIVAEPRRAALDAALAQGTRGLDQVRAVLRGTPTTAKER